MAGYKRVRGRDVQVLGLDPPQVQAAQREQMDRLKRAVEQNADAVYITDPTGRIEYVRQRTSCDACRSDTRWFWPRSPARVRCRDMAAAVATNGPFM